MKGPRAVIPGTPPGDPLLLHAIPVSPAVIPGRAAPVATVLAYFIDVALCIEVLGTDVRAGPGVELTLGQLPLVSDLTADGLAIGVAVARLPS